MKLLKIDGEYFNVDSIYRIVPIKGNYARLHFVADKRVDVTQETLNKILEFAGIEALEIETVSIPHDADGF